MSRPVSRGLFGVEVRAARALKPQDPARVAQNCYDTLTAPVPDRYQLKDRRDLFRRLVRGEPDFHGRRLYNAEGLVAAGYVIHSINLRLRGVPLTALQHRHLREAIDTVYAALAAGRP